MLNFMTQLCNLSITKFRARFILPICLKISKTPIEYSKNVELLQLYHHFSDIRSKHKHVYQAEHSCTHAFNFNFTQMNDSSRRYNSLF